MSARYSISNLKVFGNRILGDLAINPLNMLVIVQLVIMRLGKNVS